MAKIAEKTLYEVFAGLPDPRDPRGRRHPLPAVLTLAATAMLSGSRSLFAIAQWGRDHNELAMALGFTRKKHKWPCVATLHYLFKALDVTAFEAALTQWMLAQGAGDLQTRMLNIDGKTLRGSQGDQVAGVHLLAAYADFLGTALTQLTVDGKTNEHKAALQLLKLIPLAGTLITGDAAFTQRDLSQEIVEGKGEYFFTVKDNQPTLRQNILAAFDAAVSPSGESDACRERAHGPDAGQAWQPGGIAKNRNTFTMAAVS